MSFQSKIEVGTENASGYLQRLCKHFGHKADVEFTPERGSITFDFGRVDLETTPGALIMSGRAETEENLARLKRVMASHLERFAFREGLKVQWD